MERGPGIRTFVAQAKFVIEMALSLLEAQTNETNSLGSLGRSAASVSYGPEAIIQGHHLSEKRKKWVGLRQQARECGGTIRNLVDTEYGEQVICAS